jgi:hypothetical protein
MDLGGDDPSTTASNTGGQVPAERFPRVCPPRRDTKCLKYPRCR